MTCSARKQRSIRIGVYSLALVFLLRTLVPAGFMPAPLASGSPVQLCPQGLSSVEIAALFDHQPSHHQGSNHHQSSHNHHSGHHGDLSDHASPTEEFNCPLGLVLTPGVLPASSLDFRLEKVPASLENEEVVLLQTSRLRGFNPRAPPRRSV